MSKRALIIGVGGQDGSYLAEILFEQGYEVHGLLRRSSVDNTRRIQHIKDSITLHRGDLTDYVSLHRSIADAKPDELYQLADQDDQSWSRDLPVYTLDVTAGGPARVIEAVRVVDPTIKVFQPVSALMFGAAPPPQSENTRHNPLSPFACAKVAAYHLCRFYRQVHGMFVSTGIMFNHDSPARSESYVLHKICRAAVRIAQGRQKELVLGDLKQKIDIGYARDYMEAAWQMLQLPNPDDFVIGTGEGWSIEQMVAHAFICAGLKDWRDLVRVDPSFCRPGPQPTLIADITKAHETFGFNPPTKIGQLIAMLVEHEQENDK